MRVLSRAAQSGARVDPEASQLATTSIVDLDARVPVDTVHGWLAEIIERTRDPYLGLKAGEQTVTGDAGVLDYVLGSAATVERALEVAVRYMPLINESLHCALELSDHRALLRLEPCVPLPPAAEDFMLSGMYSAHEWLKAIPDLEVLFSHAPPLDRAPYRRAFGSATCRFGARFTGWSIARVHLSRPLERADENLHSIMRRVADQMLVQSPSPTASAAERVRAIIARELALPGLSTATVARALQMSVRTLTRRLEAEQTSFYSLLDDARRARALQMMQERKLGVAEIALRLGFAHAPSFHRAFRRWTGQTPSEFRRAREPLALHA